MWTSYASVTLSSTRYPIKSIFIAHIYKMRKNDEKSFDTWAQEEATLKVSTSVYLRLYLCLTVLYPRPPATPHPLPPTPHPRPPTAQPLSLSPHISQLTHCYPSNIPLSSNSLSYAFIHTCLNLRTVFLQIYHSPPTLFPTGKFIAG